jgi:DNA-directed RNA polymerase specialized sigma24 family protein
MGASPTLAELYQGCLESTGSRLPCDKFFSALRPVLNRVVSRVAWQYESGQETEDIIQEINLKLIGSGDSILAALPKQQHATTAYFSILAANCARDFFRSRQAVKRGAQSVITLGDRVDELSRDWRRQTSIMKCLSLK